VNEPKRIFLGALDVEPGQALAIDLPADLDPDAVKAAIEKANAERAEKLRTESAELRRPFIEDDKR
jgi:hypothetical protein